MRLSPQQSLRALRIVACTLLFIHGSSRLLTGGIAGFGDFLDSQHLPLGHLTAWLITLVEIGGTVTVAIGKFIRPLCFWFAAELFVGILLVHIHSGWFVVGGGSNGAEYSVLLIATFIMVGLGTESAPKQS